MKIAYITERDLDLKEVSGTITRDIRLLEVLKEFSEVDIYFNNPIKYHKYRYIVKNDYMNNSLLEEVDSKSYDIVIVSTFAISPFLKGYKLFKSKTIFYFADSAYHMRKQTLNLKYKLITYMLSLKEKEILKNNICAFLGKDEIKCIPNKYKKNCIEFPFFINTNKKLFNNNGNLIIVGDYNFKPNYIMLQNINNVADKIDNDIYVYGKNIPQLDFKSNMKIIGYAETLDEIYQDTKALLYAIDYGTGIKNKVLEAMSYGVPTIGYKEAFTNLLLEDNKHCITVNSINDLVKYSNINDLNNISNNLFNIAIKEYSLIAIKSKIENTIKRLIK